MAGCSSGPEEEEEENCFISGETAKMTSLKTCDLPRRNWNPERGWGDCCVPFCAGKKRGLRGREVGCDPDVLSINLATWASDPLLSPFPLLSKKKGVPHRNGRVPL